MSRLLNPKVILGTVVVLGLMVVSKQLAPVPLLHIQLPPEALPGWNLGPLPITNTMIAIVQTDLVLLALAFLATRRMDLVPGGAQNFMEAVVEFWETQSIQMIGERLTRTYLPLIMTIFFLVWVANWSELFPGYDSIGIVFEPEHGAVELGGEAADGAVVEDAPEPVDQEAEPSEPGAQEEHHTLFEVQRRIAGIAMLGQRVEEGAHAEEEVPGDEHAEGLAFVPFLRIASSDLNFTIGLALVAFMTIQLAGFKELGGGYLNKFFNFKEGLLGIFVGLLELVSEVSRIISYSFRLFGNLFAGQVLLFVLPFLVPFAAVVPVFGLEMFVGLIQAYVFAILTLAFVSQAIVSHDHH